MRSTACGKLFPLRDQPGKIDELMRLQSSRTRYSYNGLCEGKSKSEIEPDLKQKFSVINSRYRRCGYFRAKFNYESALQQVKAGELESPEKVVFGGRKNFKKGERGVSRNRFRARTLIDDRMTRHDRQIVRMQININTKMKN